MALNAARRLPSVKRVPNPQVVCMRFGTVIRTHARKICGALLLVLYLSIPGLASATEGARWLLQTSIYTRHYHQNPEHNNDQNLLNLEYQRTDDWVVGGSLFDNSFGQPTQYLYFGKLFRPTQAVPAMHIKLTGGLIHGYKGKYRDKIPYNTRGVAPAIIPAIGLSGKYVSGEVNFFGVAGLMVTVGALF